MSILSNVIYKFDAIPIKIPPSCFIDTDKLKIIWIGKTQKNPHTILKNEFGRLELSDFKTYYKATVIQTAWNQ